MHAVAPCRTGGFALFKELIYNLCNLPRKLAPSDIRKRPNLPSVPLKCAMIMADLERLYVTVNSKTAHPPGHLTLLKLRTVGDWIQNEARPDGAFDIRVKRLLAVGNKRVFAIL